MKTITGNRDWLLENSVSEFGNLQLTGLDFGDFDGNVFIDEMIVKRNLFQNGQTVKGSLYNHSSTYDEVIHDLIVDWCLIVDERGNRTYDIFK